MKITDDMLALRAEDLEAMSAFPLGARIEIIRDATRFIVHVRLMDRFVSFEDLDRVKNSCLRPRRVLVWVDKGALTIVCDDVRAENLFEAGL